MNGRRLRLRALRKRVSEAIQIRLFRRLRRLYLLLLNHARSPEQLKRVVDIVVPGGSNQRLRELGAFMRFLREHEPVRICEIGVFDGGTNVLLSRVSPSVKQLVGIDIAMRHESILQALAPTGTTLHLIEGRSLDDATVERVIEALDGSQFDVLFIDGSHVYEDVRGDFMRYRALVRPGGIIAFHDIVDDRYVRPGEVSGLVGGVPAFWREVRSRFEHVEFASEPDQSCYGIGALIHDPAAQLPSSWTELVARDPRASKAKNRASQP